MLNQDCFNRDFYYQLNVLALNMPALQNIPEDLAVIAQHLLTKIVRYAETAPTLSPCAISKLKSCLLEGNVRELENILEKAVTLHHPEIIKAGHLIVKEKSAQLPDSLTEIPEMPLPNYLEQVERQAILKALNKTHHNKTAAAKVLGVSFRTLRYRLSKLGLSKKT